MHNCETRLDLVEPAPPKRRRWQFTLRAAMLLVLIVAGWLGREVKLARDQRAAVQAIRAYGGQVIYDYELVNGVPTPGGEPTAPRWLRAWLGDDFFCEVVVVNLCHDADDAPTVESSPTRDAEVVSRLRGLPGLTLLAIRGCPGHRCHHSQHPGDAPPGELAD